MGGVLTYDLTPNVTHLIVGDYDTRKYRHVARERPDIRVMDVAWIDAVLHLWKNDEKIDFLALEKEHQLKAFEMRGSMQQAPEGEPSTRQSLLICLTGFGYQRDEIAEKIIANGGRHTDDLTRRCTHLVVNKPEGKKFTAAKSWHIRTVTLDWLDQSVARGMILEEEKFDPLLPPEEQGVGAWIKKDPRRQSLGKRSRSGALGGTEDGIRKLRKTASMKLNSQRNNLWGDILGRSDSREYSFTNDQPQEPVQKAPLMDEQRELTHPPVEKGIFTDCVFYINGFSNQRTSVLAQTIKGLDGQIASTLYEAANTKITNRFLIVPQTSRPEAHPQIPHDNILVVTEFYVEKCLHNRKFFAPSDHHALGRPFPLFPIPGFGDLTICTAAFTGIELSQVARSVAQLGAKFEEQFRRSTSVLVCKSLESMRKDKLRAALTWGVPVVAADWLWECISTGYNVPVDDFIFPELKDRIQKRTSSTEEPLEKKKPSARPIQRTHSEPVPKPVRPPASKAPIAAGVDPTAFDRDSPEKQQAESRNKRQKIPQQHSTVSADFNTARTHPVPTTFDPPLTELSSASLNQSPSPPKSASTTLSRPPRTTSDPTHDKEPAKETDAQEEEESEEAKRRAAKAAERQALTSKLTSLLDSTAASAVSGNEDNPQQPTPRPRRRQILGRAISNVSAGSSASASATTSANADQQHGEMEAQHEQVPPPQTQIEYHDPEAQDHKAALMERMMGGTGDVGRKAKTTTIISANVVGGRSLRRR